MKHVLLPTLAAGLLLALVSVHPAAGGEAAPESLFAQENLVAWCIVPFDASKRGPEERALMLRRLGLEKLAYDWREEHVPSFEEEILACRRHGIEFFAFWSWHPDMAPLIRKHSIRPQIWITLGSPDSGAQEEKIDAAARGLLPLVATTRDLGLELGLYNHGGWGGEPANLVAVCRRLRERHAADHVGIVYNLHHGHGHIGDFAETLAAMKPYLLCLNLNGMNSDAGPKILPVGQGRCDAALLRAIVESGYRGPIGILDHREEVDAEKSLAENLDGLRRLLPDIRYPSLVEPLDASAYGKHIQRTMTLLESGRPDRRPAVRILYYGQSIVGQRWSDAVDADLRRRYPHVDLITKNLAIGGFSSQRLVRTMHYDVFPFYPDLIVFHVYGSHIEYENIIRELRSRTTAEIILQTDHANIWPEPKALSLEEQKSWDGKMNHWFLPSFAEAYGCALQPQREEWVQYLKKHDLQPADLLTDSVHLNDHGKWLMAKLLERFLVHLPDAPQAEWRDLVKTCEVGEDVEWQGDRLSLEFEGNRVAALAAPGPIGAARVLIDGKKPSELPQCYAFTRPSGTAGVGWPAILRISRNAPLVLEDWTATFEGFNEKQTDFAFSVEGSVTGPDGSGRGRERFVSKSGRIVIEPEDWVFQYCKSVSKKPTPDGWKVRWKVIPLFTDEYRPPQVEDPSREHATVLASDLDSGSHRLELIAIDGRRPPLRAVRIHCPPRAAASR